MFENRVLRKIFGPMRDKVMGEEKTAYSGALRCILLTKYHLAFQIKENVMGGACSTYGGHERSIQGFCLEA